MLRIIVNNSSKAAKSYYAEGLTKDDYYTKESETEIIGNWHGKGCELLGLNGSVKHEEFFALCDNLNPLTGEQLTARNYENRRVGYDLNFHAPKSVSIVYAITQDKQLLEGFRLSVKETMLEIEKDMNTRVRKAGQFDNRNTGNLIYGEFIHTTSRPVDGLPDPHIHAHCFTFNATYDQKEQQWKAGEFGKIKKDASYFETYFHSKLADKLKGLGYGIDQTKAGWEIAGINRDTIDKFSRRTAEIEKIAKQLGITDAKVKDKLGAKTRKGKHDKLSYNDLVKKWVGKLDESEKLAVKIAKGNNVPDNVVNLPGLYIERSIEQILERKSVAGEREILRLALKKSVGKCSPEQIIKAYSKDNLLKANINGEVFLTTTEAINEERKLIRLATESKGKYVPLSRDFSFDKSDYTNDQKKALEHILSSRDGIIIVEGGAGTGKTTFMKEIRKILMEKERPLYAIAPSADTARGVLQKEGFTDSETVAKFLTDKKIQSSIKNGYLWVDEGGQLGIKSMLNILEIANHHNAKVIITGDTRQHNSVERGEPLRLLIEKSKLKTVRTNEILRQLKEGYKSAVDSISQKKFDKAFAKLEDINAIREIPESAERYLAIAEDYCQTAKSKGTSIVVSPTHIEGNTVTQFIRVSLRAKMLIGKDDLQYTVQNNLSPTESEKKDASFYLVGMSIQFDQNAKGFKRGSVYDVVGKNEKQLIVSDGTNQVPLNLTDSNKFSVYEKQQIGITVNDSIRITKNGFSSNGKRLNNGDIFKVKGFDKNNDIVASKGGQDCIISKSYRNFSYGYCTTSYSSQGKTVDKVIIAQSSFSKGGASQEQFYVSASRGRKDISIYTDNIQDLKNMVLASSQRTHATDIFKTAGNKAILEKLSLIKRLGNLRSIIVAKDNYKNISR